MKQSQDSLKKRRTLDLRPDSKKKKKESIMDSQEVESKERFEYGENPEEENLQEKREDQENLQTQQQQQFQTQQQQEQEMRFQEQQELIEQLLLQSSPPPQQHLASHFHLYPLVEKLSDVIETGTRDENSDALVSELSSHFDKSQKQLNLVSRSLKSKSMIADGEKRNLEESEQLLQQRRELMVEYRKSIEEIVKRD